MLMAITPATAARFSLNNTVPGDDDSASMLRLPAMPGTTDSYINGIGDGAIALPTHDGDVGGVSTSDAFEL